jgi:glycosyltransferase involved in cell wall biosynthesis
MKLLMVSGDRSILEGKRGAFWYTLEEFSKHWERIDVLCPKPDHSQLRIANSKLRISNQQSAIPFPNVHFHPSPLGLWYQPFWIARKGKKLAREHHHSVMTVHEYPPFFNGLGALRLHRATKIPYALEIHHIVGWPSASSLRERIGYAMTRLFIARDARRAAAVRVVNAAVAGELARLGVPREKIHLVPSFYLDRGLLQADPRVAKKFDVVVCGRLVGNKGVDSVLDAMTRLPTATLLVIGDGPERPTLEAQARSLGIDRRVTFVGWLPTQEDVVRSLHSARVFVMASTSEGGPRIALEAMAIGLPVVVTRVGIMPEVVTDTVNGFFTTGEPADIATKIDLLLHKEALRVHLGTEAQKILVRFERRKLIGEYAEFLQSLV